MRLFFWDASALSKRYTEETGVEVVDALFDTVPIEEMTSTPLGYAETYSIILRRYNGGALSLQTFTDGITTLQAEFLDNSDFTFYNISDAVIFRSIATMKRHNLNATDAAILTLVLELAGASDAPTCIVVASDKRLVRAAEAEGLATLNPETLALADVPAFLTSL